jgi:lipopolysaccharide heptosyltransferase II
MNILQILPELNSGGVETGTVDLAKELVKNGHKAVVISNGGRMVKDLISIGAYHYQLPVHEKSLFAILSSVTRIKEIIEREDIDIVHARSRVPAISAFFAARSKGIPFITTCHGYYSKHIFSRIMGWGKLVIVPSNVVARHMLSNFKVPLERIRLIPRGVDLDKFIYSMRQCDTGKRVYQIAVIGRITPIKGHIYLIRAMAKVARIIPNSKLYIVGNPPASKPKYKQELEILVKRLSLSRHVEFSGDCDDIPQRLKDINLLIVPSIGEETFGRVIIEAQASGVPVIASRIGGIVDIIKDNDNGILVNPRDYAGLADAMIRVIKDQQLQKRLSENARAFIEKNLTLEHMYKKTMKVYKEAVESFKILIIKWSALGDIILSLPALKAIRKKFPLAHIALLTSTQGIEIAGRFSYVDDFFVYKNLHGIKGIFELMELSSELKRYMPDLACDLQNNRKSHFFSFASCARRRIGYKSKKLDFFINEKIDGARDVLPPVQHQFRLLKGLGIKSIPDPDLFAANEHDAEYADALIKESWAGKKQKIIGINLSASSSWHTKKWPMENIVKLADLLAGNNCRVFMCGTKEDSAEAKKIISASKSKPFDITGRTDIMQLAAFIKKCDVFISGDSAPMHIASMCKVPFIGLFGPTDPGRHLQYSLTGPAQTHKVIYKKLKCSPCYKRDCRHLSCMKDITAEEVFSNVKKMLEDKAI